MFAVDQDVTPEWLELQLVQTESLIASLRARQAELVRRAQAIQVHTRVGTGSMQEWLRGRLDVDASTARGLVELSAALEESHHIRAMADWGESFDRMVATVALIGAGASAQMVECSRDHDLAGVRRIANRQRRLSPRIEREVFVDRRVMLQDSLDGSRGRVAADLPGFEYALVGKALTERADQFSHLPGPSVPRAARMADALVSIAQDSLNPMDPERSGSDGRQAEPLVTLLVDADRAAETHGQAGAEVAYGPRVGPQVLRRILCDGAVQLIGLSDGRPVITSDATKAIPPAVRRFVMWRDGGCTADGCTSRYRLQPHHIRWRSDQGDHDPDNLTTLCWFHHHVVIHGLGYRIDPESPPQRRRFTHPSRQHGPDPP